jgi:NAD(P)H-dependent FMN reductase
MKALVFAGSTRTDSLNRRLARFAASELEAQGVEVTLIDLRDYPMPIYDGDLEISGGLPPAARSLKSLIRQHDALVIASPEHNGSISALLKNTLDWVSRPEPGERPGSAFRSKTAVIMSASPGSGGGRRGLRHLREVLQNLGMAVHTAEIAVPRAHEAFDADGRLLHDSSVEQLRRAAKAVLDSATPDRIAESAAHA